MMSEGNGMSLAPGLVEAIREAAIQLEHDGRTELAIHLLKQALVAGDTRLSLVDAARLRAALAEMAWKRGSVAKARVLASDGVKFAEESSDAEALSAALFALGEVTYIEAAYVGRGKLEDALALHKRSLEVRRRVGDRRGESLSLSRMGVIYERLEEHGQAQAHYERALRIAEELDFPEGMSRPYVHIGAAKERAGDLAGALADYRRSVAAVRRAHDVHSLAFDLCNVAWAGYRLDRKLEPALDLLAEALDFAEGMGSKLAELRVHQVTGEVFAAVGRREDATREYEAAISIGETVGFPRFASFVRERLDGLSGADE